MQNTLTHVFWWSHISSLWVNFTIIHPSFLMIARQQLCIKTYGCENLTFVMPQSALLPFDNNLARGLFHPPRPALFLISFQMWKVQQSIHFNRRWKRSSGPIKQFSGVLSSFLEK